MKFRVTMKDPDTLHDAIKDAVKEDLNKMASDLKLDDDERHTITESRIMKVGDLCSTWFKWSEYLTVEIDTDAKTCVVISEKDK